MNRLTEVFHKTYYIYALFFFAETFTLYLYYYSWDRVGLWVSCSNTLHHTGAASSIFN